MSTVPVTKKFASLGDRFAELAVILLTVIALLAGWLLKTGVENRSVPFEGEGVSAQAPAGWLNLKPRGDEILHVVDRTASGFGTTYLIQKKAVAADAEAGQIVGLLTLERGNALTGYRVLKQQPVRINGRPAVEVEYVYVESDVNLTHAVLPVVVHGLDYVFVQGGQAVIVGYRAEKSVFDIDIARFYRFLNSVKF